MSKETKQQANERIANNNKIVAAWLEPLFETISKNYKNKEKLIKYLESNKKSLNIEAIWWKEFIKKLKKEKSAELNLQFIYELYLAGQGLGIDYPEGETYETNWKKRYKNKASNGEFEK
jgi:hypothetical protein